MIDDSRLALFLLLGQSANRAVSELHDTAPPESLLISPSYDLSQLLPDLVRGAIEGSEAYKLFFTFENFLRDLVVDVLSRDPSINWWDKVPQDVKDEVNRLEQTEEAKRWMALGSRTKAALMTYPQLLRVIEDTWIEGFDDLLRDKALISEARVLTHLRNTICHMTPISAEEMERIRQTMRDWFRVAAP
jgi:hypothetical protein